MQTKENEDLVQEALIVIYEKYKKMTFEKGIIPFSYEVVKNLIRLDYQTENRHKKLIEENLDKLITNLTGKSADSDALEQMSTKETVEWALRQLDSKSKKLMELKLLGCTKEEIMAELELTENAFFTRVSRIYSKLRKLLKN